MYALILLLTLIVNCILLSPGLQDNLEKVPFCKSDNGGGDILDTLKDTVVGSDSSWIPSIDCKNAVGYLGVYRGGLDVLWNDWWFPFHTYPIGPDN